jgi:tetratricopeptide (TPR) repeat protein
VPMDPQPYRQAKALVDRAYGIWCIVSRNNLSTIARLFREAMDLDAGNAEAYAGLSQTLVAQGMIGSINLPSAYSAAWDAVENALRINPDSAEANCAQAWLKVFSERDFEGARMILDDLAERGPVTTRVMLGQAMLGIAQGHPQGASDLLLRATQQQSFNNLSLGLHCWAEYLDGQFSEALDHVTQARETGSFGPILGAVEALASVQVEPRQESIDRIETLLGEDAHNYVARGVLGFLCGLNGNTGRARKALEYLCRRESHASYGAYYAMALIYLGLDEKDTALSLLEQSYCAGSLWSLAFGYDPCLSELTDMREFNDALRRTAYPTPISR